MRKVKTKDEMLSKELFTQRNEKDYFDTIHDCVNLELKSTN